MKYILFLVVVLMVSCQSEPPMSVFSGRFEDAGSDEVYLARSAMRYGYNKWLSLEDTAHLTPEGNFRFEFEVSEPDFYMVCDARGYPQTHEIYFEAGDSISVTSLKDAERNKYAFAGSRAEAYEYAAYRDSLQHTDPIFDGEYRDLYRISPDSATQLLDKRLAWERDLVRTYFDGHADWKPVADLVLDQRNYENFDRRFEYLYYHNYYTQDTFIYLMPDSAYYNFMHDVDLTYCPSQYLWQYQSFLSRYIGDLIQHDADLPDSVKWTHNLALKFDLIKSHLQGAARDAAFFSLTNDFSEALSEPDFFDVLEKIETYYQQNHARDINLEKFERVSEKFKALRTGSPAPDLALPDIHGDTVAFSDLKGKVLYVDFWGTWCYPCLMELPHSLELEEKLKGENVEFVYIGLEGDSQVEEWKEFVSGLRTFSYAPFLEQREYPGVHLLAEGQFNNAAIQPYMISYAPTYLLIDASGNIAQARAPRPSDPDIENVIRGLLIKVD